MKLYTKTGDDGTTGLFGGDRVMKDDLRVEAYGTVDETNAAIGFAAACAPAPGMVGAGVPPASPAPRTPHSPLAPRLLSILETIQSRLFDLGADLATPHGSKHESKVQRITAADVSEFERWIDEIDARNTPMTHFILPGGTDLAARLHLARTVCRRAERLLVSLGRREEINPNAVILMNRLSDLLFAMARAANLDQGVADVKWEKGRG